MFEHPYWWDDGAAPQPAEHGKLPTSVDNIVIGAGLTGLSAGHVLASEGRSVLVLDAADPGSGASSRNGGMIGGGCRIPTRTLVQRYGSDLVADLLRELHVDAVKYCLSLMEKEKTHCDFQMTGRYIAQWLPGHLEHAVRDLELTRSLAPVEADAISRSQQSREVKTDRYFGGILYRLQGGLNPAKWTHGIRCAAERAGAHVRGRTPVMGVDRNGSRIAVRTSGGTIRCKQVLIATNGYTHGQFDDVGRGIFAVPSFIVVTEPLGEDRLGQLIPNNRMIVESRERHCYFRASPDRQRLIFGGRAALFQASSSFTRRELRKLIHGIFPELSDVKISHCWKGNTGFTFETLPHLGENQGVFYALGYCGGGKQHGTLSWLQGGQADAGQRRGSNGSFLHPIYPSVLVPQKPLVPAACRCRVPVA